MTRLTVTAKGQITLKKELLKHLGVTPGQKIAADKLPDGRVVVSAAAQDGSVGDFVGCLSNGKTRKLTIEEISRVARRGWGGKR